MTITQVFLSVGHIVVFLLLVWLYRSILPRLRVQTGEDRDKFERTLVDHTRLLLLPVAPCVIVGAIFAEAQTIELWRSSTRHSMIQGVSSRITDVTVPSSLFKCLRGRLNDKAGGMTGTSKK
ncbi:hypothetical protein BC939DRAFT_519691 [Gamsiella multidivaricata]|uniref:uncharacterized protein n=1 Tax=Gamsiella multidivaricata TaxID=101098 RepID=UPI00221F5A1C|nr:uncharacterized protein BC939DRAFT_519691 [Gamsiella multidivaricata]KAI7820263.1 hypothetical protein BC939DRAFT_519691 [Gamsiella multidivaricata]